MARYIISERWQAILSPGAFVQPAPTDSPTADVAADKLDASGMVRLASDADDIPNAFQLYDTALVKRVRLWSPALALGLVGATVGATHLLRIYATRRAPHAAEKGALVEIAGPLTLGEWVDVNQTLDSQLLPAGNGAWTLGVSMPNPILLDSSRILPSIVGSGASCLLNFAAQVEVAHTLPGVRQ